MEHSAGFQLVSDYQPAGDQPQAIQELVDGVLAAEKNQVLLGVTGSGKTYTMAQVIARTQRPAMLIAHNKTLAAQLYHEMQSFFPHNAVEYFVSYYDYFQPEAYVARTDTFIEKDSSINEQIDRMRHAATRSMLERRDVIVIASVSCIYGIGSVEAYSNMTINLKQGDSYDMKQLLRDLIDLQYLRNDLGFVRGTFRVRGDTLDVFPAHLEDQAWRISFFGDEIDAITAFDPLTGERVATLSHIAIYANSHYVTPRPTIERAIKQIKEDLDVRLAWFRDHNKLLEAQRLEQRTVYDLEMLVATGSCKGIENYSRYLSGGAAGEPPPTLFQYLPKDALLFVDESHVTLPQIRGMYNGDRARKENLVDYGFRLPSAMDNRPLKYDEWDELRPQSVFVSATPGPLELDYTHGAFVQQVIRPTGLIDPECIIRPVETQVDDLLHECRAEIAKGMRTLVTTLTKKMAEQLAQYMDEAGIRVRYLHSDIDTLERIEIIRDLRLGVYDVLIGVNLLREGLDIPECGMVAILDADKEGFLRSKTALIQTIGRAARNVGGRVLLYADKMTDSLKAALEETERRRSIQIAHNEKFGIIPKSTKRSIADSMNTEEGANDNYAQPSASVGVYHAAESAQDTFKAEGLSKEAQAVRLRDRMLKAAADLEFELAATLRDQLRKLEK